MRKKILIIVALICLVALPLMAASYNGVTKKNSVSVGLNLGTNTGVGMRFGMGDFDILANVGLNNFSANVLAGDVAASYLVYTIDGGRNLQFPITVGAGVTTALGFGNNVNFNIGAIVPVGIEYTFKDVPVTLYLRLAPGVSILQANKIKVGFDFAGYLGALWNF